MIKTTTAVQQECKIERVKIMQKVSSDNDENKKLQPIEVSIYGVRSNIYVQKPPRKSPPNWHEKDK